MIPTLLQFLPSVKGGVTRKEFYVSNGRRVVVEITNKGSGLFDLYLSVPSNLRFRTIRELNINAAKVDHVWRSFIANIDYLTYSRSF